MAKTRKPCPGCGDTPAWMRDADGVCDECQKLLNEARSARSVAAANADEIAVSAPDRWHDWPHIPHANIPFADDKPGERFQGAMHALTQSIVSKTNQHPRKQLVPDHYDRHPVLRTVLISRRRANDIAALYSAVVAMMENAYAEGKRDGMAFIRGLATGETSIQEFNDETFPKKKKRR